MAARNHPEELRGLPWVSGHASAALPSKNACAKSLGANARHARCGSSECSV